MTPINLPFASHTAVKPSRFESISIVRHYSFCSNLLAVLARRNALCLLLSRVAAQGANSGNIIPGVVIRRFLQGPSRTVLPTFPPSSIAINQPRLSAMAIAADSPIPRNVLRVDRRLSSAWSVIEVRSMIPCDRALESAVCCALSDTSLTTWSVVTNRQSVWLVFAYH